jgi:hypothetical protein
MLAVAARGLSCRHAATDCSCSPCSFFFPQARGAAFAIKPRARSASARSVRAHKACNAGRGMPLKGTHTPAGRRDQRLGRPGEGAGMASWPWQLAERAADGGGGVRLAGREDEEQDAAGQAGRQPRRSSSIDMHTAQEGVASTTRRHSAIMKSYPPWSCVLLMQ